MTPTPSLTRDAYFLQRPNQLDRRTRTSMKRLAETVRSRDSSAAEVGFHTRIVIRELQREAYLSGGDPLNQLYDEPWKRLYFSAIFKRAGGIRLSGEELEVLKALGEDAATHLVAPVLASELYHSCFYTGAWRLFGINEILEEGPNVKFPVLTARPLGQVIITESSALSDDANCTGVQPSGDLEVVAARLLISIQLMQDATNHVQALLEHFRDSINLRLEYLGWSADGTADATNGGMTGITAHANTIVVSSGPGATLLQSIDHADLLAMLDGVDSAALQRRPAFALHPDLLFALMAVKDAGGHPVVTVDPDIPGETIYRCLGFPLYLTAGMPNTNVAGSKVLVFGDHRAMALGIRREYALENSAASRFANLQYDFRAWTRARLEMRRGTLLAVLKLALV